MSQDTIQNIQGGDQKGTFIVNEDPGNGLRYATGTTLRREYVFKQRQNYLLDQDSDYIWGTDRDDEGERIPAWQLEAEKLYPDEGDYTVVVETGVATYLGEM